jgi:Xaa-Pro aminopeptidase
LAGLAADSAVWLDPERVTLLIADSLPATARLIEAINPSTIAKSIKLPAEIEYYRQTAVAEGAAMCRFYAGFGKAHASGERWTEDMFHDRLIAERAVAQSFVSAAFETSAAFNANGPLLHYCPVAGEAAAIDGDGLLLIDTGGQYLGGTTDTCRVWAIGEPNLAMREDVTTALRGLIAISSAKFPVGTSAGALDALARGPSWARGLDYRHGTGHGVGYFLGCHEAPFYFGGPVHPWTALQPGAILAVEPGVYRAGKWGARLENEVLVIAAEANEHGDFLEFETLTLCPIDVRCIVPELLNAEERAWLNGYHRTVRDRVLSHLDGDAKSWLIARTEPLF